MKNIRIDKKYIAIMLLVLIVGVGTITFAYFQGSVLNDLINPTGVSTGKIDVTISDASVSVSNIKPVLTNNVNFDAAPFIKSFTVANGTDTLNTCNELYLKISSISSGLANTYFRYAVVNDDTGTTLTGNFDGATNGTELDLGSLYFFESGTVKNYTMYIWIEYSPDIDQMSMLNTQMTASLFVKAQDTKTKDACDTRSTFKLTYITNSSEATNKKVTFNKDEYITDALKWEPTSSDSSKVFLGWYKESNLTNKITGTYMQDDIKIYGGWSQIDSSIATIDNLICNRDAGGKLGNNYNITWNFTSTNKIDGGKYFCILKSKDSIIDCNWTTSTSYNDSFLSSFTDTTYYLWVLGASKKYISSPYTISCKASDSTSDGTEIM